MTPAAIHEPPTPSVVGVALLCAIALLVAWEDAKATARQQIDGSANGSPAGADVVAE